MLSTPQQAPSLTSTPPPTPTPHPHYQWAQEDPAAAPYYADRLRWLSMTNKAETFFANRSNPTTHRPQPPLPPSPFHTTAYSSYEKSLFIFSSSLAAVAK